MAVVVALVGDGWSGRPGGLLHQLFVLPCTAIFLFSLWRLLFAPSGRGAPAWTTGRGLIVCLLFEIAAVLLLAYECHHFAFLGYAVRPRAWASLLVVLVGILVLCLFRGSGPGKLLFALIAVYTAGMGFAILNFPLNYLRSDMLPVILWADTNLLHHINPYATMLVGGRVYDFPYLPGMLIAYLPAVGLKLDLRFASIIAMACAAGLIFRFTRRDRQHEVVCLLGVFLLNPFLQYRHDLYLQPHWLTFVAAFLLMQRGRYLWGAFVLGLGMAIYQFSWIVLPFVVLNGFRRRGWWESLKICLAATAGALLLAGPFLRSAFTRISNNTVGQWSRFEHAIADPMNLSYWLTYVIRPENLLRVQTVLMVGIFAGCVVRRRCATLEDTLRWTVVALTLFVLCNSLVDGYFFLMLLVPMLLFTLVANGWLQQTPSLPQEERARLIGKPVLA